MNSHAGPTEGQGLRETPLGDLRADEESDPVVHGGFLFHGSQIGHGPPSLFQVALDGFFEAEAGEVRADDDLLFGGCCHQAVPVSLRS